MIIINSEYNVSTRTRVLIAETFVSGLIDKFTCMAYDTYRGTRLLPKLLILIFNL